MNMFHAFIRPRHVLLAIMTFLACSFVASVTHAQQDYVNGNLIMINNNGGWCWYQDERTLYDQTTGRVICASVSEAGGFNGSNVNGHLYVNSVDLNTGDREPCVMRSGYQGNDHAEPALWQRPDGRYLAAYSNHNGTSSSYFRISNNPHDISSWGSEYWFNWSTASGQSASATYNNLLYLSAEGTGMGRLYNFARHFQRSPIVSYSDDWGQTWNYAGPLTLPAVPNDSYSNGYIKFISNGVDRIDFITTEAHPRHFNNNIYHGYIQGGQTFNTTGQVIDSNLFNSTAPAPEDFTTVFVSSPEDEVNDNSEYHRAWTTELERDAQGNIYALFTTRYGTQLADPSEPMYPEGYSQLGDADHRLFYAKLDIATSNWQYNEVCKMGIPLYPREQDYTGLGAINPKDPSTIYVSTAIDPRTDTTTAHREIYKGKTFDQGVTWQWTAITENSSFENLRPIVPSGDGVSTPVLWLRGTFPHFTDYDQVVVGIVDRPNERLELTRYVDADRVNTTFADGSPLETTGPNSSRSPADDIWHERTTYGNEGSIFASNEYGDEDAPTLKTTLTSITDGTYDVFAYFWSNIGEDWLIEVGFSESDMVLCERQGSQQAEGDEFDDTVITIEQNRALYRAYVGRTEVAGGSISVFIDDYENATNDGHQRVWYDGLGYAKVYIAVPGDANNDGYVNEADAETLAEYWGESGTDWSTGDFNGDHVVDAKDASIMAANWGDHTEDNTTTVPEPSSFMTLFVLLGILFTRKHRQNA